MGEGKKQTIQAPSVPPHHEDNWLRGDDDDTCNTSSTLDDNSSTNTNGSTSSSADMVDDASSPTSSSSSSSPNSSGPLFELSELMSNLPIKRGFSKYYDGKSQSFTSLSSVSCVEDLAKKEVPYRKKLKASKSYGNGLDAHKPYTLPKAVISKKVSRGSVSALSFTGRRGSTFLSSSRRPPVPIQKRI